MRDGTKGRSRGRWRGDIACGALCVIVAAGFAFHAWSVVGDAARRVSNAPRVAARTLFFDAVDRRLPARHPVVLTSPRHFLWARYRLHPRQHLFIGWELGEAAVRERLRRHAVRFVIAAPRETAPAYLERSSWVRVAFQNPTGALLEVRP